MSESISIRVAGLPPAKSEASSVFGPKHPHRDRVVALLSAVRDVDASGWDRTTTSDLHLEVEVQRPQRPPSDATNYLGGIADVLEDKTRRTLGSDLAPLAGVALYPNDNQIQQVAYRWVRSETSAYSIVIRTVTV